MYRILIVWYVYLIGLSLKCGILFAQEFTSNSSYSQFPKIIDIGNHAEDVRIVYKTDYSKDIFASSLAIGDFNGDGFNDILAGAYGYSDAKNLRFNVGRAYIIFGDSALPAIIDLREPTVRYVRITGDDPWDNTGIHVGAGDINGDGITDAVIGDAQIGETRTPGKLYIAYGKRDWPGEIDLDTDGKPVAGVTRIR